MNRTEYDKLVKDIQTTGLNKPLEIGARSGQINDGWCRYFALMQLGHKFVPVYTRYGISLMHMGDLKECNFIYKGKKKLPEGLLVNGDKCWVTND